MDDDGWWLAMPRLSCFAFYSRSLGPSFLLQTIRSSGFIKHDKTLPDGLKTAADIDP